MLVHASHFHLPSVQGGNRSSALPILGTLLCGIHKTDRHGPRSLLRPPHNHTRDLEPQESTESPSTLLGSETTTSVGSSKYVQAPSPSRQAVTSGQDG